MTAQRTPASPPTTGSSSRPTELAGFLRTRRARLTPECVGLPRTPGRRLAGLRRSEVAALAGISPEYYTRLEQGRQRHPSPEVLDALATALRLDADGRGHLHRITARPAPSAPPGPPEAPRTALDLLRALPVWPAYLVSPMRSVLAWNDAAAWLLTDFGALPPHRRNLAWFALCDPRARELYADWEAVARGNVHRLRNALAGRAGEEPLLAELAAHGGRLFTDAWNEHEVRGPNTGHKRLNHPEAGPLTLAYTGYLLPGPQRLELVVMTAPEDSPEHAVLHRHFGA
ncbi:helix-turn-helix domain-containing protein [Streptomyces formicae]|uniref:Putative DNA-binding protein n=1 Tax=Streptomyces formicae TaxID=1616117 RepID=A0A291QID2_9ACTN|nr:helix-turn-helix transcriptional regulator [Streptomyces formicae]ATL31342.1 putative DNA-binding protein [Streptomyces formicae]